MKPTLCAHCGEPIEFDPEPWIPLWGMNPWYHPGLVDVECDGRACYPGDDERGEIEALPATFSVSV